MRIWSVVVGALFYPALVWGSPVPVPEPDFDGHQYIDGSGCVFSRSDSGWVARRDGSGAQICGFPPTSTLRPVEAAAESAPIAVDEQLASLLAEGLRDGEFVGDPRPKEERAEPLPDPAENMLRNTIAARIAAGEAARVVAAGASGEKGGLCALLGYRRMVDQQPALGADVTQGLCPGMRADMPKARIDAAVGSAQVASTAQDRPIPPRVPEPEVAQISKGAQGGHVRPTVAPKPAPMVSAPVSGDLVPAHARYVLVGTFVEDAAYEQALRKLVASGYTAGRRGDGNRQGQQLLAGPFADREQLVRALNHLRSGGFADAVAR